MNFFPKLKETVFSVAPVMAIVIVLGITFAPLGSDSICTFFSGGCFVILGLTLFLLGVDIGILPVGEQSGAALTSRKNLSLLLGISFLIGFIVTVAEPDVQVLADQVRTIAPEISKWSLIFSIAGGVGFFVALGILRTIVSIPLKLILFVSYLILFMLAFFAPAVFTGVAFDSGGATTGPMTVPFIMALGVGVAAVRSKSRKKNGSTDDDSFGLTGIASVGPVFAVVLYGIFASRGNGAPAGAGNAAEEQIFTVAEMFLHIPYVAKEVVFALLPLLILAVFFQLFLLKMPKMQVIRMIRGFLLSFAGLVIFMTGAQCGFMPVGEKLGELLAGKILSGDKTLVLMNQFGEVERQFFIPQFLQTALLIVTGGIFGAVVVCAEPAVWVLTQQVEEVSGGTIPKKVMLIALSSGVAVATAVSMVRIIYRFNIMYILLPGYALALLLSLFCPDLFTGIAFDSGGVASGPMTSTFILSFALGASSALQGNPAEDAFGIIALVAMTPLIAIQILGIIFKIKVKAASFKKETGLETAEQKEV